jgi:hypothetical protein
VSEIAVLVRASVSWAQTRHVKVGTMASLSDDITDIKIKMVRAKHGDYWHLSGITDSKSI